MRLYLLGFMSGIIFTWGLTPWPLSLVLVCWLGSMALGKTGEL